MDKIKLAQRTIAMLSSMIESGECHTIRSKEMINNALNGLKQLTIPVVVGSNFICNSENRRKEKCKEQCSWCDGYN